MRRAKPLSEVWIHFERLKIDNKYMAKKKKFFLSWWFFPEKKKKISPEKKHLHHYCILN